MAKRGRYGDAEWNESSHDVLRALERVGVRFEITGIEHVERLEGPCVFVGNHMSVLETFILPGVIRPIRPVTFIVKESLLTYPVFGHVMRSRDPVAVTRTNPRQDFKAVMEGGKERLLKGISLIVFPQTTRHDARQRAGRARHRKPETRNARPNGTAPFPPAEPNQPQCSL